MLRVNQNPFCMWHIAVGSSGFLVIGPQSLWRAASFQSHEMRRGIG